MALIRAPRGAELTSASSHAHNFHIHIARHEAPLQPPPTRLGIGIGRQRTMTRSTRRARGGSARRTRHTSMAESTVRLRRGSKSRSDSEQQARRPSQERRLCISAGRACPHATRGAYSDSEVAGRALIATHAERSNVTYAYTARAASAGTNESSGQLSVANTQTRR